jgi:hypothetical protein
MGMLLSDEGLRKLKLSHNPAFDAQHLIRALSLSVSHTACIAAHSAAMHVTIDQ